MDISIKSNMKQLERDVGIFFKSEVPFVTSQAINDTAFDVRAGLKKTLSHDLHNPTPWTLRGVLVGRKAATKRNLTRTVDLEQSRYEYLQYQIFGGTRRPERKLIAIGKGIKRNKYGNVSRATAKRAAARKDTFWGTIRGTWGLWQRRNGGVSLLIAGTSKAEYRQSVSWFDDAQHIVSSTFNNNFAKRFARVK